MASGARPQTRLEAASPFEMRVKLGENVPETDVRSALRTGDMGFLHSFTTGSAVDGPGIQFPFIARGSRARFARFFHGYASVGELIN